MSRILLCTLAGEPADELRAWLTKAGYMVSGHPLQAAPSAELHAVGAVVFVAGPRVDQVSVQIKRWRAAIADRFVPFLVVQAAEAGDSSSALLDAGADVVVNRPCGEQHFLAQLRRALAWRTEFDRLRERAEEARLLGERLRKNHEQNHLEYSFAARLNQALRPTQLPDGRAIRCYLQQESRPRTKVDAYDVRAEPDGSVAFYLAAASGSGILAPLKAILIRQTLMPPSRGLTAAGTFDPSERLDALNQELLRSPEPVLTTAVVVGRAGGDGRCVHLARAGLPRPVRLPATGRPEIVTIPSSLLGLPESRFPLLRIDLEPGERLVWATHGLSADDAGDEDGRRRLASICERHRERTGQSFVDAVLTELLTSQTSGDLTVLCLERAS